WVGGTPLPGSDPGAGGRAGGLQGSGRVLPLAPFRDRESGISAQYHVPLLKIPASDLELRESHHGEKTSRVGRPQRVRWQCHVRDFCPAGISAQRQSTI